MGIFLCYVSLPEGSELFHSLETNCFFSQKLLKFHGMQNTFWGAFWQHQQANFSRTSQFCFKEMPWFCCFLKPQEVWTLAEIFSWKQWKPISFFCRGKHTLDIHATPKNQQLQSKIKQDSVLHKKMGKFCCCVILQDGPLLAKTGAITPINGLINW